MERGALTGRRPLTAITKWTFGVGHVLNDLCASMWFSYLLIYFHKVVIFDNVSTGIFLLVGQIADGLATPVVGIQSDQTTATRYGKRKIWHLAGTAAVALTFPFIFNLCLYGCANNPRWTLFFYYVPFIIIFQFGWASTQISHLALIPDLASNTNEKVTLNAIRYGFTIFSNVFVYAVFWVLFEVNSTPGSLGRADASKFRNLVLIVVSVGILFSIIFHVGVKEKPVTHEMEESLTQKSCQKMKKTTWTAWLKEVQFWQVGMIYMMTRLIVNLSQVYIPLYITDTLFLDKKTIAIIPLIIYVSGIVATATSKPLSYFFGLKITYFVGLVLIFGSSFWLWALGALPAGFKQEIYAAAVILGFGCSTLLVTSLAMTAELVGDNTCTGAFIYGAMSFFDKVANGTAVMVIQKFHPSCDSVPGGSERCPISGRYYRVVLSCVPGGAAVLAMIILATLARSKIGSKKTGKAKRVINEEIAKEHSAKPKCNSGRPINYGSTDGCSNDVDRDNKHNPYLTSNGDIPSHAGFLGDHYDTEDDSYASPKDRELAVCAEGCRCKICLDEEKEARELYVCPENCRCKICVNAETEALAKSNGSIQSGKLSRNVIST